MLMKNTGIAYKFATCPGKGKWISNQVPLKKDKKLIRYFFFGLFQIRLIFTWKDTTATDNTVKYMSDNAFFALAKPA